MPYFTIWQRQLQLEAARPITPMRNKATNLRNASSPSVIKQNHILQKGWYHCVPSFWVVEEPHSFLVQPIHPFLRGSNGDFAHIFGGQLGALQTPSILMQTLGDTRSLWIYFWRLEKQWARVTWHPAGVCSRQRSSSRLI